MSQHWSVSFAVGALALLVTFLNFIIIPVIPQIIVYTVLIIYVGSHWSLTIFLSRDQIADFVSSRDAMLFPILGSVALSSLSIAYYHFGSDSVNKLMLCYTSILCFLAFGDTSRRIMWSLCDFVFPGAVPKKAKACWTVLGYSWDLIDISSALVSAVLSCAYIYSRQWTLHNIFALVFAIQSIAKVHLGRFIVAFTLLLGLLIYDVFWVMGTDVMVNVAQQFEGPAKLVVPLSFDPWNWSILGLGDIIVPGVFIAMCLRFDASLEMRAKRKKDPVYTFKSDADFPQPYFHSALLAYVAALFTAGLVMSWLNAAQPVLLYLLPSIVTMHLFQVSQRGDFPIMLRYNEQELIAFLAD